MAESGGMLLGFVLTLMLHASVLLGAVWLIERAGGLRNARWAELAWRGALFGAVLSAAVASTGSMVRSDGVASRGEAAAQRAPVAAGDDARPPSRVNSAQAAAHNLTQAAPRPPQADVSYGARAVDGEAESVRGRDESAASAAAPLRSLALALPRDLIAIAAQTWLALAAAWLLLTASRVIALLRLQRRARRLPSADASQQAQAESIAHALQREAPRLHLQHSLVSPVALPANTLLLPAWSRELSRQQSRALLAHELAHLQRRDPYWRIAQHLALAPLCLHPLAWHALRRLDALAERQADAMAAQLLGDGRALAECLAHCLERRATSSRFPAVPRFALAMAERPGAVVDRVQRLLDEDPMSHHEPSPRRTRLALALGLCASLALPGIAVTAFSDALARGQSVSVHTEDGRETVRIRANDGAVKLQVDMQGEIGFAPDEADVLSMGTDAQLEIEETRDGVRRRIEFSAAGDGVQRDYRVEGRTQAFDADARAWLARVLPELFRRSGVQAEARVARILAQGGSDALLDEIALIQGDHGRSRYLALLYANATLTDAQQTRALELTGAIGSDHELRRALEGALASRTLTRAQQRQVLAMADEIGSDHERAELLIATIDRFTPDADTLQVWQAALDGIGSGYENRRVLEALLMRTQDNADAVRLALDAAARIGSDYEKRQLLQSAIVHARDDAALRARYLQVAAGISSDYERREALLALLRAGSVDAALALQTLDAIDGIGSDHETRQALVALAQVMPAEIAVIDRYRVSAQRLSSSHERGEVERALDRRVLVR